MISVKMLSNIGVAWLINNCMNQNSELQWVMGSGYSTRDLCILYAEGISVEAVC